MAQDFLTNPGQPDWLRSQPLGHLSINSYAATLFEIRIKEQLHPLLGLRQAALTVREKQQALSYHSTLARKNIRRVRAIARQRKWLSFANRLLHAELISDRIEAFDEEMLHLNTECDWIEPLIRDAQMELAAAVQEHQRMVDKYPEITAKTYMQLQLEETPQALMDGFARTIAGQAWAKQMGYPEAVGRLLFDMPDEMREGVLRREQEIRSGVTNSMITLEAQQILASMPSEIQSRALLVAARLVSADESDRDESDGEDSDLQLDEASMYD